MFNPGQLPFEGRNKGISFVAKVAMLDVNTHQVSDAGDFLVINHASCACYVPGYGTMKSSQST